MAIDVISVAIADADADAKNKRVLVPFPAGYDDATIQAFADEGMERVDRVVDGEIMEVTLTKNLPLLTKASEPSAGEIKNAPVAASINERGGLMLFDTTGPAKESVWLPSFSLTHLTGTSINVTDQDVVDFIDFMTVAALYNSISFQPHTKWDYLFSSLSSSRRAVRRK